MMHAPVITPASHDRIMRLDKTYQDEQPSSKRRRVIEWQERGGTPAGPGRLSRIAAILESGRYGRHNLNAYIRIRAAQ